jgi:hypothetical protein
MGDRPIARRRRALLVELDATLAVSIVHAIATP